MKHDFLRFEKIIIIIRLFWRKRGGGRSPQDIGLEPTTCSADMQNADCWMMCILHNASVNPIKYSKRSNYVNKELPETNQLNRY